MKRLAILFALFPILAFAYPDWVSIQRRYQQLSGNLLAQIALLQTAKDASFPYFKQAYDWKNPDVFQIKALELIFADLVAQAEKMVPGGEEGLNKDREAMYRLNDLLSGWRFFPPKNRDRVEWELWLDAIILENLKGSVFDFMNVVVRVRSALYNPIEYDHAFYPPNLPICSQTKYGSPDHKLRVAQVLQATKSFYNTSDVINLQSAVFQLPDWFHSRYLNQIAENSLYLGPEWRPIRTLIFERHHRLDESPTEFLFKLYDALETIPSARAMRREIATTLAKFYRADSQPGQLTPDALYWEVQAYRNILRAHYFGDDSGTDYRELQKSFREIQGKCFTLIGAGHSYGYVMLAEILLETGLFHLGKQRKLGYEIDYLQMFDEAVSKIESRALRNSLYRRAYLLRARTLQTRKQWSSAVYYYDITIKQGAQTHMSLEEVRALRADAHTRESTSGLCLRAVRNYF